MYENREEYSRIVGIEVRALETSLRCRIRHGYEGVCPRCGSAGNFDLGELGFDRKIGNPIYFSTVFNHWRCGLCDFRIAW
jgi:hypothetical protein